MALLAILTSAPTFAEDSTPLSLVPSSKESPASTNVVVRVGQHEDFDRIVFDWPRNVPYKITRDGKKATITFSSPGAVELKPTSHLTRGKGFTSSTDTDGHLVVSFNVDGKSTLKDFFSGNSIAVDITGPEANDEPVQAAMIEPTQPKEVARPAVEPEKVIAATEAKSPVATAPPAWPVPVATSTPETNPTAIKPTQPLAPTSAPAAQDLKALLDIGATNNSPSSAEVAPASPSQQDAEKPLVNPATQPLTSTKISREIPNINIGTRPVLVAALDSHTPMRAAVWGRAGYGYILFDKKLTLSSDELNSSLSSSQIKFEPLDLPNVSGFRFAIPNKVEVNAQLDGTSWKIYLTKAQPEVPVSASLVAQPDFALGARYLFPLPDAPQTVRVYDRVVGDELMVVPLNQTSSFTVTRRMADFQIIAASQGLVIKPLTEKVIVRTVSDGIEITADSGLHLSPAIEAGLALPASQRSKSSFGGKSLFDFMAWRGGEHETFTQARQRFQQTIIDVPERERNRARLEFARFYFSRGYGMEAVALINGLAKQVPDLMAHSDFLALSGASKILASHPDEGLKDLTAAALPDLPETKLWQAVANAEIGNWTDAEALFASSEPLLAGYPEPFFSRFFVLAIESALAVGNDHEAADWLNVLQTADHGKADVAIEYLHGVLHAKAGRAQAAATSWKKVEASTDRLYKVRAEMALIDLGVANMSLSPAQAADRLEALRFAWRGDDLEVDILHRLGLFYIKARNIKTGLAALAQALQLYPHSPLVAKMHDEMAQTFHDVFIGDLSKTLTPLDALGIYQQYRDTLMPTGEESTAITKTLAEHLAAIDLVDQACELLFDLAKNKLHGAEKGRVVVRLAALRMVDHKSQAALEALDLSSGDFLPAAIQQERLLLRAKALLDLKRYDEALAEIANDNHIPAKMLRAEINMSTKNWQEAAKDLLDLAGPPPTAGANFKEEQADWLLRAAVSMAMSGDQVGLDRLAIDYGAAMAGTSQKDAFRMLVQPEKEGDLRDIASIQRRISDVDMFQGFLNYYRKSDAPEQPLDKSKP